MLWVGWRSSRPQGHRPPLPLIHPSPDLQTGCTFPTRRFRPTHSTPGQTEVHRPGPHCQHPCSHPYSLRGTHRSAHWHTHGTGWEGPQLPRWVGEGSTPAHPQEHRGPECWGSQSHPRPKRGCHPKLWHHLSHYSTKGGSAPTHQGRGDHTPKGRCHPAQRRGTPWGAPQHLWSYDGGPSQHRPSHGHPTHLPLPLASFHWPLLGLRWGQ